MTGPTMSIDPSKVTICMVMTILLVLMPQSGYLSDIDNQKLDLEEEMVISHTSESESIWVDGGQPWPQSGKTPGRESLPPHHSPDGGAGIGEPENASEYNTIIDPVINWQYDDYVYSTDSFATPIADLTNSIITSEDSIERCGGDSLFTIIIQTEDIGGNLHSVLKIIEGEDADLAWQVDLGETDEIKAAPVIVDLNEDGIQEIIVAFDMSGTFYVKSYSPELVCSVTGWSPGGSHSAELLWTYSDSSLMIGSTDGPYVGSAYGNHKPTAQPLLADLDLDGTAELVLSLIDKDSDDPVVLALDLTGTAATSIWQKTLDKGTHPSDPAFVQTDENTAFILLTSVQSSSSAMWVWKLDANDGDANWDGKSLENTQGFDSNVPHIRLPGPVISNLDSDEAMEMIITIPSDFDGSSAAYGAEYYGLEIFDGTKIWDFEASNGFSDSAPISIDTDGDGDYDRVCWITWTTNTWNTNRDGFAGCHDDTDTSNPQEAWSKEILEPQGAPNDGIAIASPIWMDIDGSDEPELLVPYGRELRAYDGEVGTMAGINEEWNGAISIGHRLWSSPALADIDGDATLDLVLGDTVISLEIADIRPQQDGRSIEFSPVAPDPGETVTITVSFENAGTAETNENTDVVLYADGEVIARERFGNMQPVDPTGTGSLSTFTAEWSGGLGEHDFELVLDPYRNLSQSRYDNDFQITTLNVVNPYNASFEIPTEPTRITPGESSTISPNIRSTGRLAGIWSLSVDSTNLPEGWTWNDETPSGLDSIEIGVDEIWNPYLRVDAPEDALGSDSGYLTLTLTLDEDNNVSISSLLPIEANRTRGLSIRGPDGTANSMGYGLTGEYAEAWMLIHNLGNAEENQIIMSWDTTAWGNDLKLFDLDDNQVSALTLEPDEMILLTARLQVPNSASLGDLVNTPLEMCVTGDVCQTIELSFMATGTVTDVHQRTVPDNQLSWDISTDMPVGESQLEWSMSDAGLILPGWIWSTSGDLEIIDGDLVLSRSGPSRVYGTISLHLPHDAAPAFHSFMDSSTQSTDHKLQFSLEVLQIYRADLTVTSPLEQPHEVEVEEDVLVMIKLENPGNGEDTFRLEAEVITDSIITEDLDVTISFVSDMVTLGAGSLQTIPVIVKLPENTPAATPVQIRIKMTSQGNEGIEDSETLVLSAKQDHRWEIDANYLGNELRNRTIISQPGETNQIMMEAKNVGNLEDDISLETTINVIYSGSDISTGWNASGTSVENISVNSTVNLAVNWFVPENSWNGSIMQITVDLSSRGEIIDTIIFYVEVPHIEKWNAISSQVDLEIDPDGSSIDLEIIQLGNAPSKAFATVYVNGSNNWIVETPEELPILEPGESAMMTLNITPPQNAQHGKTVELHVRLREGTSLSETIVPLRVSVIHQFDLDGESPWVISSEGGFPHATLLNEGNAPTTISLNVRSVPTGWTVTGDTTIVLSVGEIRGIPIQIIPDMNWNGETYTIKIEAIDELGNVDEILLDTTKQDYSWASSPIISAVNGDNVLLKIHGTNSQSLVLDGSQGLLEWDSREGWLWPAFQSISDGEITINSEEGLVYTSYVSMPSIRDGFCTLNNDPNNILASCSISNGTGDYDYTLLLIDDKGKLIDSLSGTLGDNMSLDNANLSAINWAPEPGIRTLILRAMDSRGIEFASISIDYEIIRSDWNIGLTGIELIGTGKNQQIQITTIRENQNLLSEADCLLTVESDDYIGEHIIDPSGVYLLPKIDRPPIPDGSELVIQFNCAFPWNVESNLNDNEVRIILTGGKDTDEGIQDFETGLASALLVIGLASALAWLVKNHRERKEMMQITEKAIMQHLSKKNKSPIVTEEVKEEEEEIENTTSLEKDEKELNAQNEVEEVIEEELDEFELRLRRLGKL
ncbi:MAG: hypothetical protein HOG58_01625 [Euryarchaeota archaeon]|nr:hypothetical protein [Euryarchaeota archaeon]